MNKKPTFKANGYLKKTYLDKDGAKQCTFEFSCGSALELAKLELMSRDLDTHLPILLEVSAKQSNLRKVNPKYASNPPRELKTKALIEES